jgi:hypothetical protein
MPSLFAPDRTGRRRDYSAKLGWRVFHEGRSSGPLTCQYVGDYYCQAQPRAQQIPIKLREAIDVISWDFFSNGDSGFVCPLVEWLLTGDDCMLLADYQPTWTAKNALRRVLRSEQLDADVDSQQRSSRPFLF